MSSANPERENLPGADQASAPSNCSQRKVMFAIMVSEPEVDMLKMDAESLKCSEDPLVSALGERMLKATKRAALKLGFKYEH